MKKFKAVTGWKLDAVTRETLDRIPGEVELVCIGGVNDEERAAHYADMDVLAGMINMDILKISENLKFVQGMGHGINNMPRELLQMLKDRDVVVCKSSGSAVAIAEYMMMAMSVLSRRILIMHNALVAGNHGVKPRFEADNEGPADKELAGKTLAVLGLGSIGKELCKRAAAFDMRLIGLQRVVRPELKDELGLDMLCQPSELHRLLSQADFIGNTLPLTTETTNMIDAAAFEAMKDGAYIVNVGRAYTINQEAMYEALKRGKLAGAALDVWDNKQFPGGRQRFGSYPTPYPIHQYNVLMTPHMSGVSKELRVRRNEVLFENLERFAAGRPLTRVVDLDAGY
ncbi:NAD(P)-dependent oxidoreductase [Candidatus Hydrogenedentota bacterium]